MVVVQPRVQIMIKPWHYTSPLCLIFSEKPFKFLMLELQAPQIVLLVVSEQAFWFLVCLDVVFESVRGWLASLYQAQL